MGDRNLHIYAFAYFFSKEDFHSRKGRVTGTGTTSPHFRGAELGETCSFQEPALGGYQDPGLPPWYGLPPTHNRHISVRYDMRTDGRGVRPDGTSVHACCQAAQKSCEGGRRMPLNLEDHTFSML